MDLTDEQWAVVEPVFRHRPRPPGRAGRPPREPRDLVDGILWVLRTGAPWADLPSRYPPYQTCHRWFQTWCEDGTLKQLLIGLANDLRKRGGIDDIEGYIDGSYVGAKKGGPASVSAAPAMRPRSWRSQTALVFLSPSASQMVRDTTSPSSTKPSTRPSPSTFRTS